MSEPEEEDLTRVLTEIDTLVHEALHEPTREKWSVAERAILMHWPFLRKALGQLQREEARRDPIARAMRDRIAEIKRERGGEDPG